MVDQDLLTVFVTLTALAVLIQTGILVGFYFLSRKLSRQADRAIHSTHNLFRPLQNVADTLQSVSARAAEIGASTRGQLRQFELSLEKTQSAWHERVRRQRRQAV